MTQYDPFCTSIVTSNQITREHYYNIIIKKIIFLKEEHLLADLGAMMSSELRRYFNNFCVF